MSNSVSEPAGIAKVRGRILVPILVALLVGVALGLVWQGTYYPKRFGHVAEGRLYRSGEVSPAQLEHLREDLGVRRVICLLDPSADVTQAERAAAERLGIEWHNVPMGGSGQSTTADRERVLALLRDPNAPPTLVHCAAGANRTGLAVGLYRIHEQGWSYDQVLDEMRRYGFEDLPKHEDVRQALREAAERAASKPATVPGQR